MHVKCCVTMFPPAGCVSSITTLCEIFAKYSMSYSEKPIYLVVNNNIYHCNNDLNISRIKTISLKFKRTSKGIANNTYSKNKITYKKYSRCCRQQSFAIQRGAYNFDRKHVRCCYITSHGTSASSNMHVIMLM